MEPSQPWGPGQAWIKLKRDSMEEKVSDQPKPVEPEQKLLPQVDEEGLPKAQKGEGWWKAWVKVRRPNERKGGRARVLDSRSSFIHYPVCRPNGISEGSKLKSIQEKGLQVLFSDSTPTWNPSRTTC